MERRLWHSGPVPSGLWLEELQNISPVGRRPHTSVRSCVIVPMFVLSCLRVDSILCSQPIGQVFWSGGPVEEGTTSTPLFTIIRYWIWWEKMVSQKDERKTFKNFSCTASPTDLFLRCFLRIEQAKVEIAVVVKPSSFPCSKHTC